MDASCFDREALLAKAAQVEEDGRAPEWLARALRALAEDGELLPREEDAERFVVEYIYPH